MTRTLGELAQLVGGRLQGDPDLEVTDAVIIRDVQAGQITLASQSSHLAALETSPAAAVVAAEEMDGIKLPAIFVNDVAEAFAQIVLEFRPPPRPRQGIGIHPTAVVSDKAQLGEDVSIGPWVIIEDHVILGDRVTINAGSHLMWGCKVGDDCEFYSNCVLYEHTIVGRRVTLHAGVILGAHGFGYSMSDGRFVLSSQLGNVVVEDDVEIGPNSTIDRGTYSSTLIGEGTKIDNMVMIAHNVRVGRHNILCGQVGIAGSSSTGDYVVMAGQVGVKDHIVVGNQVHIGAKSGIRTRLEDNQKYFGNPAQPARQHLQTLASLSKLPAMRNTLQKLEKRVAELEEARNASDDEAEPRQEAA